MHKAFQFALSIFLFIPALHAQPTTIIIGDSIFAWGDAASHLREGGLQFDMLAVAGANMDQISNQYREWRDERGVPEVVIMNGGGNDIIQTAYNACLARAPKCFEVLERVIQTGYDLFREMDADGVERVVHVGIHYLGPIHRGLNWAVDVGMDELVQTCPLSPLPCSLVDLRPSFKRGSNLLELDGLHPNKAGAKVIADLILEEFADEG